MLVGEAFLEAELFKLRTEEQIENYLGEKKGRQPSTWVQGLRQDSMLYSRKFTFPFSSPPIIEAYLKAHHFLEASPADSI